MFPHICRLVHGMRKFTHDAEWVVSCRLCSVVARRTRTIRSLTIMYVVCCWPRAPACTQTPPIQRVDCDANANATPPALSDKSALYRLGRTHRTWSYLQQIITSHFHQIGAESLPDDWVAVPTPSTSHSFVEYFQLRSKPANQ